jgi:hypothetical protein
VVAGAYDDIVADDPEGFSEVRRRLEDWFPKLTHVATSSQGASVGEYIADYVVTPQILTRAFLASTGMTKDSLGARVVESKHTGRWRFACKKMHEYFGQATSPGRLSKAYTTGSEPQHTAHTGNWDRNPFLAAMLEIHLSMTGHPLDHTAFNPHRLWSRICGGEPSRAVAFRQHTGSGPAGYRVPTTAALDPQFESYGASAAEAVPITDFAPFVAYGSLETLRSQRMLLMAECLDDFAPEDAMMAAFCKPGSPSGMGEGVTRRAALAPFAMQRDLWCNPHRRVTIE